MVDLMEADAAIPLEGIDLKIESYSEGSRFWVARED